MLLDSPSISKPTVETLPLRHIAGWCSAGGFTNTRFVCASADCPRLPQQTFDFVYCRFLLLHVPDPISCLREMRDLLKAGGILFVEDGDLASARSEPATAFDSFADLFRRLGPVRGVDYSFSNSLYHAFRRVGFHDVWMEIHQPVLRGLDRQFLMWSVEEAGPAFVDAGLITAHDLRRRVSEMQERIDDPNLLVLAPPMSQVWARTFSPGVAT